MPLPAPLTFPNEQAAIAAFLDSPAGLPEAVQFLTPEDFSDPSLRTAWEWISGALLAGRPVDLFSLSQRWASHEMFPKMREAVTGCRTLFGEGLFYATVLKDRSKLRKAHVMLEKALEITGTADTFDTVRPALEAALVASFEDNAAGQDCHIREAVAAILEQMRNPSKAQRAYRTGFAKFDAMFSRTGAPAETNMIVIAGKSGEGKSSVALNILETAACEGTPCKVYSMEMDRNDLAIRSGLFFARDAASYETAMQRAADLPIWFSDRADRTAESIRSDIRLSSMRHGVKVVMIDYIQLAGSAPSKDNRERQVAAMSRMFKVAAMESKVLVYVLSQLNDEGKLRESRAIEQDADGVVYVVAKDGHHYLWVSKNRRGPKHGDVKDIPTQLDRLGIKLDFDSANFRFHPH